MTKKEAIARRDAWEKAVNEGRVVNFPGMQSFQSYKTVDDAEQAVEEAHAAGLSAHIVCA